MSRNLNKVNLSSIYSHTPHLLIIYTVQRLSPKLKIKLIFGEIAEILYRWMCGMCGMRSTIYAHSLCWYTLSDTENTHRAEHQLTRLLRCMLIRSRVYNPLKHASHFCSADSKFASDMFYHISVFFVHLWCYDVPSECKMSPLSRLSRWEDCLSHLRPPFKYPSSGIPTYIVNDVSMLVAKTTHVIGYEAFRRFCGRILTRSTRSNGVIGINPSLATDV